MQQANVLNIITNKYEPPQKHRPGTVSKKITGGGGGGGLNRIKKIHASYTLEGTDFEKIESIKYLGVTITSDLRWNTHVSNVCTKVNRTLGFLRRNLYSCP